MVGWGKGLGRGQLRKCFDFKSQKNQMVTFGAYKATIFFVCNRPDIDGWLMSVGDMFPVDVASRRRLKRL